MRSSDGARQSHVLTCAGGAQHACPVRGAVRRTTRYRLVNDIGKDADERSAIRCPSVDYAEARGPAAKRSRTSRASGEQHPGVTVQSPDAAGEPATDTSVIEAASEPRNCVAAPCAAADVGGEGLKSNAGASPSCEQNLGGNRDAPGDVGDIVTGCPDGEESAEPIEPAHGTAAQAGASAAAAGPPPAATGAAATEAGASAEGAAAAKGGKEKDGERRPELAAVEGAEQSAGRSLAARPATKVKRQVIGASHFWRVVSPSTADDWNRTNPGFLRDGSVFRNSLRKLCPV